MTLAKYGWFVDCAPKNLAAFSTGAAANAVNIDSFHTLSGTAASPGQLSEFTMAGWFYYDLGANTQIIDFASVTAPNGFVATPYFGVQIASDPFYCAINFDTTALAGNQNIQARWEPTLPTEAGWVLIVFSVQITDTTSPGAANISLMLGQHSLGRAGDQSVVMTGAPATINLQELPDFSAASPDWVLNNDGGFNDSAGGVDWVCFIPTYYDLTVQANRELFSVDDGGTLCPVDPTPLNPLILFRGDATEFATNQADSTVWTETDSGGPLVNYPAPICFGP